MKKLIKRFLWILLISLAGVATWFAWPRLPIITAFAAKGMCSSVFLADKTPERVYAEDLSFFPISLARCEIDYEEKLRAASFIIPDPGYSQDTILWPKGDVIPESLPVGVDYSKLSSILNEAIDDPGEEPFKKTLGVAVVYDHILIGENYLEGYDAWTKFHGWSMTKSVTGALAGTLVMDDLMDVKAAADIPELSKSPYI